VRIDDEGNPAAKIAPRREDGAILLAFEVSHHLVE
jgi:hypothetical protein